jgi:hypothetical protein
MALKLIGGLSDWSESVAGSHAQNFGTAFANGIIRRQLRLEIRKSDYENEH